MGAIRRRGNKLFIRYYANGKRHEERVGSDDLNAARHLLRLREGDIARGVPVIPQQARVTVGDLLDDLLVEYRVNKRDSLVDLGIRIRLHLRPALGARYANQVTGADITRYIEQRQEQRASNATINRELACLKRAYNLAVQGGRLLTRPHVAMLVERNARTGFFEDHQLEAICRHLPSHIADAIIFASITGWRIKSAVLTLAWKDVDFEASTVRLLPEHAKNDQGVVFPLTRALRQVLVRRFELIPSQGIYPLVFGFKSYRRAWLKASKLAGCPGRIPHDLCRTAVRNLVRAGVPERVAMQLTGRKTRSVFDRYNITSQADLTAAGATLDAISTKRISRR